MERRKGMSIMLSALWLEVGRRAGIRVDALAMPGHYITRVGGDEGPLLDPSSGGCCLSVERCAEIVAERSGNVLPWQEEYLEAITDDHLVERALTRLSCCQRGACNPISLYRTVRFQAAIRPDDLSLVMVLATLAEQAGAVRHARDLLQSLVDEHPQTPESRAAARWLPRVTESCTTLH